MSKQTSRELRLDLLRGFLEGQGWNLLTRGQRFGAYEAPDSLASGYFELVVPLEPTSDQNVVLSRLAGTLAEIYEVSFDHIATVLTEPSTVAAVSVGGRSSAQGSMPFVQFDNLVDRLRKLLLHTASFVLTEDPVVASTHPAAQRYVRQCRILQSEHGSYVTKIQLPNQVQLTQSTMFGDDGILSDDVNDRAIDVIEHVVSKVMSTDSSVFSEAALFEAVEVVNVTVLRDIAEMFQRVEADYLDFRFLGVATNSRIQTGRLTDRRIGRLNEYIEYARDRLARDLKVDVIGRIVELRSRHRDRRHNYVGIMSMFDHEPVFISFVLGATAYQAAVRAHERNELVRVSGLAKRLQTQLRVTRVAEFEVIERSDTGSVEF